MVTVMAGSRTCLLVLDLQAGFFELPRPLFRGEELIETVRGLLREARSSGCRIVYVQHSGSHHGPLATGSHGWHIHPAVAPEAGECVLQKTHCDAFGGTGLEQHLRDAGVERVVVCGLVTEGCVDTTIRRAFGLGFRVEVVSDGHSTTDSGILPADQIVRHHNDVFKIFAEVTKASNIRFSGANESVEHRGEADER
jgi:nicotinamidase-related amidase